MDYILNKIKNIPEFLELGKEVYVVYGPNRMKKAKIKMYHAKVFVDPELGNTSCCPFAASFSAYFRDDYFSSINWNIVPFEFIAKNKKQAEEWAKVFSVECSDEDWYKAIGERPKIFNTRSDEEEDEDKRQASLENSELSICCADISAIRDTLIKCRDYKGLIGLEIGYLKAFIKNSGHDMPEDTPVLESILKQLEIKWE